MKKLLGLGFMIFASFVYGTTYYVNNQAQDDGTGGTENTLSWAIDQANSSNGADSIRFTNFTSYPQLSVSHVMPSIVSSITIDGSDTLVKAEPTNGYDSFWTTANISSPTGGSRGLFFLSLTSGQNVAFENLSITGNSDTSISNNIPERGGAIFISGGNGGGNVTLENLCIRSFQALNGGAVYVDTGLVTFNECNIYGNTVAPSGNGGGISNWGGNVIMNDSSLYFNSAGNGGAIYNAGIFKAGGVMSNMNLNNVWVSNNSATSTGGGICNFGANLTISNSSHISENKASSGGGVYNNAPTAVDSVNICNNCIIESNTAENGGGIYNFGVNDNTAVGSFTIQNSTVRNNTANISGGGIYNSCSTVTVEYTTFQPYGCHINGNTCKLSGAGIYNDANGVINILNAEVCDNINMASDGGVAARGGAINNVNGGIVKVVASHIGGNVVYFNPQKVTSNNNSPNNNFGAGAYQQDNGKLYMLYSQEIGDDACWAPNTVGFGSGVANVGGTVYCYYAQCVTTSPITNLQPALAPNYSPPSQMNIYYSKQYNDYYFLDTAGTSHLLTDWNTSPPVVPSELVFSGEVAFL